MIGDDEWKYDDEVIGRLQRSGSNKFAPVGRRHVGGSRGAAPVGWRQ